MANSQSSQQQPNNEREPNKGALLSQEIDLCFENLHQLGQQIKEFAQEKLRLEQRQQQILREWERDIRERKRLLENIIQYADNYKTEGYTVKATLQKGSEILELREQEYLGNLPALRPGPGPAPGPAACPTPETFPGNNPGPEQGFGPRIDHTPGPSSEPDPSLGPYMIEYATDEGRRDNRKKVLS